MNESNAYTRLRLWYLARLRKLSLASESELKLTPAALISADKENIERQILAERDAGEPTLRKSALFLDTALALLLGGGLVFTYQKVINQPFDLTKMPDLFMAAVAVLLLAEAVFFNLRK